MALKGHKPFSVITIYSSLVNHVSKRGKCQYFLFQMSLKRTSSLSGCFRADMNEYLTKWSSHRVPWHAFILNSLSQRQTDIYRDSLEK